MSENTKLIDCAMQLTFEAAYAEADKLEGRQEVESDGVKVISGKHPVYGCIHITIPMTGDGFLLKPFAIQDF